MANPIQAQKFTWTFKAGADLSGKQFHAVKAGPNEGEVIAMAADSDRPVGTLQNKPTTGQDATILISGISYFDAQEDLAYGDLVRFGSNGTAEKYEHATDEGNYLAGWVLIGSDASSGAGDARIKRLGSAIVDFCNMPYNTL